MVMTTIIRKYTFMRKYTLCAIAAFALSTAACTKFKDINTNPETPETVKPAMLATRIILNLTNQPSTKSFMQPYMLTKQIAWSELSEAYQFNGLGTMSMSLTSINDAHFMVKFANTEQLKNSYEGLMYFARAMKFYDITMALGDIPYKDALQGETEKVYFPRYDLQKDVFLGILGELEKADNLFSKGSKFEGDPIFGGDTQKWRKVVNSFALNVLIQLSKKENEADLNLKARFEAIVKSKPIFTSNADNLQLIRTDKSGQVYPFHKISNSFVIYPMVSSEIIDRLQLQQDRRLFYYANPSPIKIKEGLAASDFQAYIGVDPSLPFSDLAAIKISNDYAKLNDRYTELVTGEPTQIYGYQHLCFVIAEAAARGWTTESALGWYKKGIEASMKFIASNTPAEDIYNHGMPLDNAYIETALARYEQAFPTAKEPQIDAIITQKYLASFLQATITPFYDYRRTGYPNWKINAASSMNADAPDKMPLRWRYPAVEFNYNAEHVNEAIERQYQGVDDVNKIMWLLK